VNLAVNIDFDPWDIDPKTGSVDAAFPGEVLRETEAGFWLVALRRPFCDNGREYWNVALIPRYVGQPAISAKGEFPYVAGVVFLDEAQAAEHRLHLSALQKLPGMRGVVRLI
jgi:hypothetical protein